MSFEKDKMGVFDQKNGLSRDTHESCVYQGFQTKYRF